MSLPGEPHSENNVQRRIDRRGFLQAAAGTVAALSLDGCGPGVSQPEGSEPTEVPSFLQGYEQRYHQNPRAATLQWFNDAKFGLFLHYGVYSQLGRGAWAQLRDKIPVAEYAKLEDTFRPDKFNAEEICELARAAGMKYINLTARHHDSFCLFRTNETDFNSLSSPVRRDLVGELSAACNAQGLGLFLYYSYALDWKHPYFYSRQAAGLDWPYARPAYDEPQPEYLYEKEEDFTHYIKFVHSQLEEMLYRYTPLAGIWLDPIMGYYNRPELFPIEQTYELIREAQPGALICFKQGANGDEDLVAPERTPRAHPKGGEVARIAWEKNEGKPIEICDTLQPRAWGYDQRADGKHRTADEVLGMLEHADKSGANLLLNTGPLPDGSIHVDDVETLREVGKRRRA